MRGAGPGAARAEGLAGNREGSEPLGGHRSAPGSHQSLPGVRTAIPAAGTGIRTDTGIGTRTGMGIGIGTGTRPHTPAARAVPRPRPAGSDAPITASRSLRREQKGFSLEAPPPALPHWLRPPRPASPAADWPVPAEAAALIGGRAVGQRAGQGGRWGAERRRRRGAGQVGAAGRGAGPGPGPGSRSRPRLRLAPARWLRAVLARRCPRGRAEVFRMNLEKLSKPELLTLFSILEGELEARDLVIEALKAQHRDTFIEERYGKYNISDPLMALQRDFETLKEGNHGEKQPVCSNPLSILKVVMKHCKNMQERMLSQLAAAESRHRKVILDLEEERQRHAQDAAEGDDVTYMLEKERERLTQQVEFEKSQVKKFEKEQKKLSSQLEEERARHKQLSSMLVVECKKATAKAAEEGQKTAELSLKLEKEKSKVSKLEEELAAKRKRGLQMEAQVEKQLSEFDIEREQLKAKLNREENRTKALKEEVECLKKALKELEASCQEQSPCGAVQPSPSVASRGVTTEGPAVKSVSCQTEGLQAERASSTSTSTTSSSTTSTSTSASTSTTCSSSTSTSSSRAAQPGPASPSAPAHSYAKSNGHCDTDVPAGEGSAAGSAAPRERCAAASEGSAPRERCAAASEGSAPRERCAAASEGSAPRERCAAASEGSAPRERCAAASEGSAPRERCAAASEGSAPRERCAAASEGGAENGSSPGRTESPLPAAACLSPGSAGPALGPSPCSSPVLGRRPLAAPAGSPGYQSPYQVGITQRFQAARHRFQAQAEQEQQGGGLQSPPARDLSPTLADSAAKQLARNTVTQVLSRFTSQQGAARAVSPGSSPFGTDYRSLAGHGPGPAKPCSPLSPLSPGVKSPTIPRAERGNPPPIPPKKPGLAQSPAAAAAAPLAKPGPGAPTDVASSCSSSSVLSNGKDLEILLPGSS